MILLSGAGTAQAQTNGVAHESGKERLLRSLTGESDAAFERLMDRCILDHGRRVCPDEDREVGTTGEADIPLARSQSAP